MLFIVTIQDKTLYGEPDVAIAVVDAPDEEAACRAAHPTIEKLADRGRGRCVPHARAVEPGKFYRLGALVRLPRDPNGPGDPVHFDHTSSPDNRGQDVLAFQKLWNLNNPNDQIAEDGAYGPQTEARFKKSSATGFTVGPTCGTSARSLGNTVVADGVDGEDVP